MANLQNKCHQMDKQVCWMGQKFKMMESTHAAAVQTITYKRKTHKRKRADLLAVFPTEEVHHELSSNKWIRQKELKLLMQEFLAGARKIRFQVLS